MTRKHAASEWEAARTIPPPPRKPDEPFPSQREAAILHWLREQDRWESIDWQLWRKFRREGGILPGVSQGLHYFLICICADGQLINFVPHRYLIDQNGRISPEDVYGLSCDEREDCRRLSRNESELTPAEQARLDAIQKKIDMAILPPKESMAALARGLSMPPKPQSEADRFLKNHPL